MKLRKETKIGIAVVITLAFFIWGFSFLKGKNLLSSNYHYYSVYDHIDGLAEASPVHLSGYKVGVVEAIKFHNQDRSKIVVRFSVQKDVKIPKKSTAVIFPETLIAGKAIKLIFSEANDYYQSGDTIPGVLEKNIMTSLSEELLPVKNKIENLVVSMDSVLTIFDNTRKDNLKKSLDNIHQITDKLEGLVDTEKKRLSNILANVESISGNLNENNEQITTILENFSNISDSLQQANLKSTLLNAHKTFAELSEITEKINQGKGTIGMLINNDSLYVNLNHLASDLDSLVIDLNENPNRYVHFSLFGKKNKE
ncbi:MAG: MlaD family protein [Bacteroidales bacterium]|jgi:phospholipid/cholesterol/gamma-HCH transport system substrate-binding protein|nr:MlaD family protein [Bacteroidales bacterium]